MDAEWAKTKESCDKTKQTLTDDMATNKVAMEGCKSSIDGLEADFAGAKETLIETEAMLKDDQTYLKDLTERCEARAKDWDQRSQQRNDEVTALAAALEILKKGAVDQEAVNKRAFVQSKQAPHHVASFLQLDRVQALAVKNDESAKQLFATVAELKVSRVVELLRTEGQRLGSSMLASLASKASADPFKKVKELIQKLVERLVAEATAEATKKVDVFLHLYVFCLVSMMCFSPLTLVSRAFESSVLIIEFCQPLYIGLFTVFVRCGKACADSTIH